MLCCWTDGQWCVWSAQLTAFIFLWLNGSNNAAWSKEFKRFCLFLSRAEWCLTKLMCWNWCEREFLIRKINFAHKFMCIFTERCATYRQLCQAGNGWRWDLQGSCGTGQLHCVVRLSSRQEKQDLGESGSLVTVVSYTAASSIWFETFLLIIVLEKP